MLSPHDSLLTHSFWGAAHGTNPSSPPLCALPALWDGSTQRTAPRRSQEASPPLPGRSASSHGAASIILIAMATQHPPPRSPPPHKAAFGTAGCQRCTFDTLSPPREVGAVKGWEECTDGASFWMGDANCCRAWRPSSFPGLKASEGKEMGDESGEHPGMAPTLLWWALMGGGGPAWVSPAQQKHFSRLRHIPAPKKTLCIRVGAARCSQSGGGDGVGGGC